MGAMTKMDLKVKHMKWLCLHLKLVQVKISCMKNNFFVLFFKMTSVNIFYMPKQEIP